MTIFLPIADFEARVGRGATVISYINTWSRVISEKIFATDYQGGHMMRTPLGSPKVKLMSFHAIVVQYQISAIKVRVVSHARVPGIQEKYFFLSHIYSILHVNTAARRAQRHQPIVCVCL